MKRCLFKKGNEEFICKVASTIEDASAREDAKMLIEVVFDYVCEFDGAKMFRKRK